MNWRDELKPEEARAIASLDAELAPLLDRVQAIRDRRNRIVNRAICRGRMKARRNVSHEANTDHMISHAQAQIQT